MWKTVLAGTAALAIAGSSFALAQQPNAPAAQWRPSAEDISALTDARIAGLKAALKLTPDQEKNWPPVEQAIRDLAKARFDRMTARRDQPQPADAIERLRRRADAMTERAAGLKRLADASEPLYRSLDEAQKRRLAFMTRAFSGRLAFAHGRHPRGADRPQ